MKLVNLAFSLQHQLFSGQHAQSLSHPPTPRSRKPLGIFQDFFRSHTEWPLPRCCTHWLYQVKTPLLPIRQLVPTGGYRHSPTRQRHVQENTDPLLTTEYLSTIGSTDSRTLASTNHLLITTILMLVKYGSTDFFVLELQVTVFTQKDPVQFLFPILKSFQITNVQQYIH